MADDLRKIFEFSYAEEIQNTCNETKYEWAANLVFNLTTYDGSLDELFVKKIIEICKVILDGKNYEYIRDENNYKDFILVCQLLHNFDWINWGTSIRGAWFERGSRARYLLENYSASQYIDDEWREKGHPDIPFSEENLRLLIEFIEEEENAD
jgi:hypothetical protein